MELRFHFDAARAALGKARHILVVAHRKPDGDTIGAASAMIGYFRSSGIAYTAFCADPVPPQYVFLSGTEEFTTDTRVFADPSIDALAVFDAGDLKYAGIDQLIGTMPRRPVIVNFDHHVTNVLFGDVNVVQPTASSTAEVVHQYFVHCGIEIGRDVATCLLMGILFDTSNFSNAATTDSSIRAASALLRKGGSLTEVVSWLVRNKTVWSLRLWGDILSRLKYHEGTGVASTAAFPADYKGEATDEQMEGLSNFLGAMLDAKVILVLKDLGNGKVKGSLRTVEDIDVSTIAKLLGGGGHRKAAGFTIPGRVVETADRWMVGQA